MKNADGVYIGMTECKFWKSVDVKTRTCCGGRLVKFAEVTCEANGVVEAKHRCNKSCTSMVNDTERTFVEAKFKVIMPASQGVK